MAKKQNRIYRIAFIGPESTGKTTLSGQLAEHYKTVCVNEYARTYLEKLKRKYTLNDILKITKHQVKMEKQMIPKATDFIFTDTELIIAKVWAEDVFKICPDWISKNIKENQYDLYLLTYPDLVWEKDFFRENPTRRKYFFNRYEKELKAISADYEIIKGKGESRLRNCIAAIDSKFSEIKKTPL